MAESMDYLVLFWLLNLYLWYQTFQQFGKKPVDVVTLIFVVAGSIVTGSILNDKVQTADIPFWAKLVMFLPYLIVAIHSFKTYHKPV